MKKNHSPCCKKFQNSYNTSMGTFYLFIYFERVSIYDVCCWY